jgi:hypothetical protein
MRSGTGTIAILGACGTALFLGACGTSTSGFVGSWTIPDGGGSKTINCPGGGTTTLPITGQIIVIQGSSGNGVTSEPTIVATIDGQSEDFTVTSSTTAALQTVPTILPLETDAGIVQTLTLPSDSIVVNGSNLSETASGTLTNGDAGTCTFLRNVSAVQGG